MRFILSILVNGLVVFIASQLLSGVEVNSFGTAIVVAVVLAIVNFLVKPLLKILTLPITILTLGLFLLVINGLMILLVDYFVGGFEVDGLFVAIIFSIILAILNTLASWLLPGKELSRMAGPTLN